MGLPSSKTRYRNLLPGKIRFHMASQPSSCIYPALVQSSGIQLQGPSQGCHGGQNSCSSVTSAGLVAVNLSWTHLPHLTPTLRMGSSSQPSLACTRAVSGARTACSLYQPASWPWTSLCDSLRCSCPLCWSIDHWRIGPSWPWDTVGHILHTFYSSS